MAKIGGKDARVAIAVALEKNPGFVRLEHALRWFDDPEGARKSEEMAKARKAEVLTKYVNDCVEAIFDRFVPGIAVTTPEQVDSHYRDWHSDAAASFMSGSLSEVRKAVEEHLMSVKNRGGFDEFRVRFNDHWQCVVIEAFYQRMANITLVWRSEDSFSFAHT